MPAEIKSRRQIAAGQVGGRWIAPADGFWGTASGSARRRLSAPFAAAQHLGMAGGPDRLDHLEDALADPALADLVIGANQLERLALDQRVLLLLQRRAGLAQALSATARHVTAPQTTGR